MSSLLALLRDRQQYSGMLFSPIDRPRVLLKPVKAYLPTDLHAQISMQVGAVVAHCGISHNQLTTTILVMEIITSHNHMRAATTSRRSTRFNFCVRRIALVIAAKL